MKILDRYIERTVIYTVLLVVLVLLGLELFVEFTREYADIGTGNYTFLHALVYIPMMLPLDTYQFFPMAGLLGSILGLGLLAAHSEIIVMRVSGCSVANITWAIIKAAIFLSVIMIILGEIVAPLSQKVAVSHKMAALSAGKTLATKEGYWVRDKDSFVHIDKSLGKGKVLGVTRYKFDSKNQLASVSFAKYGNYQDKIWTFFDVIKTNFNGNKAIASHIIQEKSDLILHPRLLGIKYTDSDQKFLPELFSYIKYRKQSGLDASRYEFVFWQRVVQPLATLVMIIIAVPFVFGPLRSANMGFRMLTGVILGITFYLLNQFAGSLSYVIDVPPLVVALVPTLFFAMLGGLVVVTKK